MEQRDQRPSDAVPFQTAQIIAAALILGPLIFAGVAIANTWNKQPQLSIITYMAMVYAAGALIAAPIVSRLVTTVRLQALRNAGNTTVSQFFAMFQTRMIIRSAILEGAAFFALVAYMTEMVWWTLAVTGVLLAAMVVAFPRRGRFDDWVRQEREMSALERPADSNSNRE